MVYGLPTVGGDKGKWAGKLNASIAAIKTLADDATSALETKADAAALTTEVTNRGAGDTAAIATAAADATAKVAAEAASRTAADATKVDATAAGKATLAVVENSKLWPYRAALGRRDTDPVNIGILGASSTEGAFVGSFDRTISSRLATLLRNRYPTTGLTGGGRGFIGVPSKELTTSGQYVTNMWPLTFTGGLFDPPSNGAASAFDLGAKHMLWYTTGSGKVVDTLASAVTSFDIHHVVGPSGGATAGYYKIDGGTAVVFSTFAVTAAHQVLHVASPATSTIEVGWSSGASKYILFTGITEYAGDETKGIQVHNLGHSGMKIAAWQDGYALAEGWRAAIASLNLDLLVLHDLGANDAFGALTPAQVKTALVAFIAVLRSGGITCPIVLSAMFDPTGGGAVTPNWAAYATIMREIADADSTVVFVDHSVRMPSTAVTDTLALYSTVDHVHARTDGAVNQWIASTYDAILAAA